jgi:hypothetical protein
LTSTVVECITVYTRLSTSVHRQTIMSEVVALCLVVDRAGIFKQKSSWNSWISAQMEFTDVLWMKNKIYFKLFSEQILFFKGDKYLEANQSSYCNILKSILGNVIYLKIIFFYWSINNLRIPLGLKRYGWLENSLDQLTPWFQSLQNACKFHSSDVTRMFSCHIATLFTLM